MGKRLIWFARTPLRPSFVCLLSSEAEAQLKSEKRTGNIVHTL